MCRPHGSSLELKVMKLHCFISSGQSNETAPSLLQTLELHVGNAAADELLQPENNTICTSYVELIQKIFANIHTKLEIYNGRHKNMNVNMY